MGTYPQQERIQNATRTMNEWNLVEEVWYDESELLKEMLGLVAGIIKSGGEDGENINEDLEDVIGNLTTLASRFSEISENVNRPGFQTGQSPNLLD